MSEKLTISLPKTTLDRLYSKMVNDGTTIRSQAINHYLLRGMDGGEI